MKLHANVVTAALSGSNTTMLDRVLAGPTFTAVIDGATNYLTPDASRAAHYVDTLAGWLTKMLTMRPTAAVALRESIAATAAELGGPPDQLPSATVAITSWDNDTVQALVLGDCTSVAMLTDETQVELHDTRLAEVGAPIRSTYHDHLRIGRGFDHRHRALLSQLAKLESEMRNVEGGYWVAQADPTAADRALFASWPAGAVHAVVLATDGARAGLVDVSGVSWKEVAGARMQSDLERLLARADTAERSDPNGKRWPRSKPQDNKAVAVMTRVIH